MISRLKLLKIINLSSSLFFIISGVVIYYGISLSVAVISVINILIGSIFIGISIFNYSKIKAFLIVIERSDKDKYSKRVIINELVSQFFFLLISMVCFFGIFSRVFFEKLPVFD